MSERDDAERVVDGGSTVPGDGKRLVFACAYRDVARAYAETARVEERLAFRWPEHEPTAEDGENIWIFAAHDEVVTCAMIRGSAVGARVPAASGR